MLISPAMARMLLLIAAVVALCSIPSSPAVDLVRVVPMDGSIGRTIARTAPVTSASLGIEPLADCGELEVLPAGLCTHGGDTSPAEAAGSSNSPGAPVPARDITCPGNGTDGQRVEVLYAHGPAATSATAGRVEDIERWVGQVEWTIQASASRFGGDRRVRWVTSGCALRVASVEVSDGALRDFGTMIDELSAAGFDRSDRTYMLFTASKRYCGIATAPRDDRMSSNLSTRVAGYARIDKPCWGAGDQGYHSIAAHELLHTLGAVQSGAPHGTSGGHCSDEHDVMCYDDGSGTAMTVTCRDGDGSTQGAGDLNDRLADCGGDDYFHPAPRSGSYLASHWNTASHPRLYDPSASSGNGGGTTGRPTVIGDPVGFVVATRPR